MPSLPWEGEEEMNDSRTTGWTWPVEATWRIAPSEPHILQPIITHLTMSTTPLPQPGIPGFAPALVSALSASPALRGWPVDGALVAVLLLALMTRHGGVLLDVSGGVSKVAKVVGAVRPREKGLTPAHGVRFRPRDAVRAPVG